jgi:hypothetical protein
MAEDFVVFWAAIGQWSSLSHRKQDAAAIHKPLISLSFPSEIRLNFELATS